MLVLNSHWLLIGAALAILLAMLAAFVRGKGTAAGPSRASAVQIILLLVALAMLAWMFARDHSDAQPGTEVRPEWKLLNHGITEGVSGLAWVSAAGSNVSLLAVHDNKQAGEKRLSLIERTADGGVKARALAWTAEPLPIDLEAICRVPGKPSAFLGLTSRGALYRFTFDATKGELGFDGTPLGVPNAAEDRQFESLDVQQIGGQTFACWAERGDGAAPGVIFCSTFDTATSTFGEPVSAEVRADWPQADTRHLADLRLLNDGTIVAASASDPGNAGPFSGAVFVAGTLQVGADRPQIIAAQGSPRLFTTTTHKIEALELVPGPGGGLVLGSDDENLGAAVLFTW